MLYPSIRSKVIQLTLLLFMFLTCQAQAQTVNIFVHQWPSASWGFPDPVVVNTAYSSLFSTVNITTGLVPSTGNLGSFDVLIMCELTYSSTTSVMSNAQRGVVEAFITNGGHVVWVAENSPSQAAPGSDQVFFALQNLWGISLSRTPSSGNPCVPYHGGGGPGGLTNGVGNINTTTSYDYFSGPGDLHQHCVLSVNGGQNSCSAPVIRGMGYLFPEPYICDLGGTIVLYGEVQIWSSLMTSAPYLIHYRNVAAMHHAIMTADLAAIDAINLAFSPNPLCTQPTVCSVLSVEWGGFELLEQGESSVKLLWWTSNEVHNQGFEIEHAIATDGDMDFEKIGWVEGAGNTEVQQAYEFWAGKLVPGNHHFRIKSVDQNGQLAYSEVRSLKIDGVQSPVVYPTTWESKQSQFKLYLPINEKLQLSLMDIQGKSLVSMLGCDAAAGSNLIDLPDLNLSRGTYLLKIMGNHRQVVKRVFVY